MTAKARMVGDLTASQILDFHRETHDGKLPVGQGVVVYPITLGELTNARIHPRVLVPDLTYADVRIRNAAGGTGKTTCVLFEAAMLALQRPIYGKKPVKSIRTAVVTREDSREILVARLREIIKANDLTDAETQQVMESVAIVDLTSENFRLCLVAGDVVYPNTETINELTEALRPFAPDWVVFDPLVSFGVGESRVNDAEQGLIEAFRVIKNRLDCCVEGVHHTGKANARNKADDQYAGRGGSALADGARMVVVINPLTAAEWVNATGTALLPEESGLVMAFPKLSYCQPQKPAYIRRRGYLLEAVTAVRRTPEQESAAVVEQIYRFICDQYQQGRFYSITELETQADTLSLTRKQIRTASTELKVSGRVLYQEVKGKRGSHYQPF